jgi:cytochrome P450
VNQVAQDEARARAAAFDLARLDAAFLDDPYPTYRALQRFDPVRRLPDGSYFLTRHADLSLCYRDRRLLSDKTREFRPKFGNSPLYRHHTSSLVFNDPPLHTRVRKLLAAAFTPRTLQAMEARIVALVDRLLDRAAEAGRMDLIADFAAAVPIEVIGDMLGVPRAERGPLRGYSLAILGALEPVLSQEQLDRGNRAVTEFSAYLDGLIAERRRRPSADAADVLSQLVHGEVDGERLTHDELVQNCIFLLNAGHETTTNLIGNGVDALLRFPDQLARLRAEPGLIRTAVEEMLRYESSNQLGNRRVGERLEIGGVAMEPGTYLHLCIGAANRDPAEFADPDCFDIARQPNRHLAFGAGPHICLGNTLARMEGAIAIGRLVRRFPRLRRDGAFQRGGRARFRGFASYPVALT